MESDLIDCVIGLGANLFFNAPMEACVVVCKTRKRDERKGKILFINAIHEVTRKNAQSWLEDEHIEHIVNAYFKQDNEAEYSRLVDFDEIANNQYNLNIPLYIRRIGSVLPAVDFQEYLDKWQESSSCMLESVEHIIAMMMSGKAASDE